MEHMQTGVYECGSGIIHVYVMTFKNLVTELYKEVAKMVLENLVLYKVVIIRNKMPSVFVLFSDYFYDKDLWFFFTRR